MAGRHAYHGTTRWAYTWLDQRVSSGLEVRSRCLAVRIQPLGAAAQERQVVLGSSTCSDRTAKCERSRR